MDLTSNVEFRLPYGTRDLCDIKKINAFDAWSNRIKVNKETGVTLERLYFDYMLYLEETGQKENAFKRPTFNVAFQGLLKKRNINCLQSKRPKLLFYGIDLRETITQDFAIK